MGAPFFIPTDMSRSSIRGSLVRSYVKIGLPPVGLQTAVKRRYSRDLRQLRMQHLPRLIATVSQNLQSTVATAKQWDIWAAQDTKAVSSMVVPSIYPVRRPSGWTDARTLSQETFHALVRNKGRAAKITPSSIFSCCRKLSLGLGKVVPRVSNGLFAAPLGPRANIHLKATAVRVLL